MHLPRVRCALLLPALLACLAAPAAADPEERVPNRPKVPGKLCLTLRERHAEGKNGPVKASERAVEWDVAKTAIIVCDMWDGHYCKSAAQRVKEMVPRMNRVLTAARSHGVMIVHAPSGTMNVY